MMFEKAARMKLRFSYKGQITVEDLWDLSAEKLDGIYRTLRVKQRDSLQESLLKPIPGDEALNLRVDIVKHIVQVKLQEALAKRERAQMIAKGRRIATILAEKRDQSLRDKSEEELVKLLEELEE
jgi:hypothetical protein